MAPGCGSGNSVLLLPQCTAPLQFDPSSADRKLCTLEMHREEAEDHTSFQPEGVIIPLGWACINYTGLGGAGAVVWISL
jgi:hypothetical protein